MQRLAHCLVPQAARQSSAAAKSIALEKSSQLKINWKKSILCTQRQERKKEIPVTAKAEGISYHAKAAVAKPRVLIPVFPGTNCEFDSAKAVERAGAEANIFVINNLSAAGIADSIDRFAKEVKQAQTIFIPGGFSGGDEPDGSVNLLRPSSVTPKSRRLSQHI